MARLSLFLPSFAADYSGVCSCLFDLDALVVVADAACCTRNYIDYDEPRWSRGKTTTLCAQLRTLDVVMGDEAKTVAKVAAAARELEPRMVALLGSPVPAITGMDWLGLVLISFVLPAVLTWLIAIPLRKCGWIKDGDLKLDL